MSSNPHIWVYGLNNGSPSGKRVECFLKTQSSAVSGQHCAKTAFFRVMGENYF